MSLAEVRVYHTVDPCADPVSGSVEPNIRNKLLIMNQILMKKKKTFNYHLTSSFWTRSEI